MELDGSSTAISPLPSGVTSTSNRLLPRSTTLVAAPLTTSISPAAKPATGSLNSTTTVNGSVLSTIAGAPTMLGTGPVISVVVTSVESVALSLAVFVSLSNVVTTALLTSVVPSNAASIGSV